jgi:hypothetical protein
MYNLLVSANSKAWDTGSYEFELNRCVKTDEYSDPAAVKKYGKVDEESFAELAKLPALFAYENGNQLPARLGWIKRVRVRQNKARFEFEFDPSNVSIPAAQILAMGCDLDISEWEMNRHHWAVKNVDLFEALGEAGLIDLKRLIGAQGQGTPAKVEHYEIKPRIFRSPEAKSDDKLVSVMMPYVGFDAIYDAIKASVRLAGLSCERADKFWEESELIQDIFSLIYRSRYVICDFSGSNPNVFYEAGIAHTLGREVIPISQSADDVPFDLRHHRYIRHLNNQQGLEELTGKLTQRLDFLRKKAD